MKKFTILISDRNRNVRELLKREMMAEGYRVRLAKSAREILKLVYHYEPLDLLILDPDLPDAGESFVLERVSDRIPTLPVVVHTYSIDHESPHADHNKVTYVEKNGSSIEHLKKVVYELLNKPNP